MESVGDVEEVRMNELECLRNISLEFVLWVVDEFNPTNGSLMSDVVLDWSANLTLAQKSSVDKLIEQTFFQWHLFFF